MEIALERDRAVRLLGCGIRFFLAAALSAGDIGGTAPFALGWVAAAGAGPEGLGALIGAGVGALVFMEFSGGLAFLAVAILSYTAAVAFRGLRLAERSWFAPLCGAGMFLAVGLIYVLQSLSPLEQLPGCLTAAALVGVSAWAYRPLLRGEEAARKPESVAFLALTLLLPLCALTVGEASIGRALIGCGLLYLAYQQGPAAGMTAGVCAGLIVDLWSGMGTFLFTAGYGLAGLFGGSRTARGRPSAALCWLAGVTAVLLPTQDPLGWALGWEALAAAPLFLLLPGRLFGGKRVRRNEAAERRGAMDKLKSRLTQTASALRELYDNMGRAAPDSTEENPAVVFDRAAEKTCRECALCGLCWQREYTGTFNALNDATPYLMERGRAMGKDFPGYFTQRCIHLPEFLTAVNEELSAYLLRKQYRRQLEETRRSARGQYAQLSELLNATAAGLEEARTVSGRVATWRVGAALRPKGGESVCGDTVTSFETETGTVCLLLSDGMGSGEAARRESALTCRLLRQFLDAGIQPEAALKTLNSAMALRGEESGSFTTVDLLTYSPVTGEAAVFKYGAAPSYIKRGGNVRRITGVSLPAGLRTAPGTPDVTRVKLEPDGFAVLVSDGVADAAGDEWLQNLLAGYDGQDPQQLANLIMTASLEKEGKEDDCGVQVLYIDDFSAGSARGV